MARIFFLLITICELFLLGWALRRRHRRHDLARFFLLCFIAALALGNAVMSLGGWVGEGVFLEKLHRGRLVMQGLCLPLLIYFSFDLVKRTGLEWARRGGLNAAVWAIVFTAIVMQCGSRLVRGPLMAVEFSGIPYYRETGFSEMRLPFTLSLALIITFGLILFRRRGSPWIALGAFGMFLGAATPAAFGGPAVNALMEMAFAVSLLQTATKFADPSPNA